MKNPLYIYAIMVLTTAVGFAGYTWIDWKNLDAADWAAWVGALGTIFAFLGTIWLATSETRRRKRADMAKALLFVPHISMKTSRLRPNISLVITILVRPHPPTQKDFEFCIHHLNMESLWSLENIEPLICLADDCAIQLATIKECIETVTGFMKKMAVRNFTSNDYEFGKYIGESVNLLRTALLQIDRVNIVFENAHENFERYR